MINSPQGYYIVGDHTYVNKTEAVYQATQRNQTVYWNFHEDTYKSVNWLNQPTESLAELYKQRAQQLRDKYDYIVVQFSGGMDSWNVLNSFLANGIHVDEVFTRWARAERNYIDPDPNNLDEINYGSEFEYAVLPVLDHIQKNYPKTRIVVDDMSEELHSELTEDIFKKSNGYQNMLASFRFTRQSEYEKEQLLKGKRVGMVVGYEKTRCAVIDGNLYAYFVDCIGGGPESEKGFELFYLTPDFPKLAVAHAHAVKDRIKELQVEISITKGLYPTYREIYQQACYPEYNINTFQTGKVLGSLVNKGDHWIFKYSPQYFKSWKYVVDQYFKSIDKQFLANKNLPFAVGLKLIKSPYYLLESNTDLKSVDFLVDTNLALL